jgi:peptidoglycan/xylan/chitin deacetylase (PgdA/CDA1 family)
MIPTRKGLAVLMYHKVSEKQKDSLTVTTDQLESHFRHIKEHGYNVISFRDLERSTKSNSPLPEKPVILTFDDGYVNNLTFALPLLEKFRFKATIFIPAAFIGKTNVWDEGEEQIMNTEMLKNLHKTGIIDIGLHSYNHINYDKHKLPDIEYDIEKCLETLKSQDIPHIKTLAYPYGKYPGRKAQKNSSDFNRVLEKFQINFGLRIGSKLNRLPVKDRYNMTRTNIKGNESFFIFKTKLKKGRAKLFK